MFFWTTKWGVDSNINQSHSIILSVITLSYTSLFTWYSHALVPGDPRITMEPLLMTCFHSLIWKYSFLKQLFLLRFPPAESLKYQRSWKCPDLEIFCNEIPSLTFWDVGTASYQHEWLAGPSQTQHISCRVILITDWDRQQIIVYSTPVQSAQQLKFWSNNTLKPLWDRCLSQAL